MEKQKKLFEDLIALQYRFKHLAAYVQNDFQSILDDKIVSRQWFDDMKLEMNDDFEKVISELNRCKVVANNVIDDFLKSNEKTK